ncbi:hypothetical protein [Aeromicrobium sp.]|uniref:hypothetical protein n=1 Tax=Aeromicrobium sp. TaxID=1871063 RepID=UPI0025BFE66E|nr:hypothetical protein [Aeromicrobium sp.]
MTLDLSRLEAIATLGVDVNIVVNNAGLQHVEAARPGVTSDPTNSGYVRTALVEQQTADQAELHEMSPKRVVSDVLMERSALERLSDPNEVASLAGYLRSPPAGAITGASLVVAGRWPAQ